MTRDEQTENLVARLKELDSQQKTIIVLLADLRAHFDKELQALRNQLNTMIRQQERIARAALNIPAAEDQRIAEVVNRDTKIQSIKS